MKTAALILFICCSTFVFGQNKNQPDSLKLYREVEKAAKKKKSTYWLYKEIFNLPDARKKKEKARKQVGYQNLKGRIIREIHIETLDPFGYSVPDTSKHPSNFTQKSLNVLHQKSTRSAILNRLLYKTGDSLDPLVVKESERILRQSPQVREIITTVKPIKGTDSVDIYIREQDLWSKTFGLAYSSDRYVFNFSDQNFLGLAHYFKNDLSYHPFERKYVASGTYSIPYIRNYLIIPTLYYNTDPDNFFRGFSISRPFVSPLFKWAGSAQIYDIKSSGIYIQPEGPSISYSTRNFVRDFWLGRSFNLSNDTMEEIRMTKLIVGARYYLTTFNYHAPEVVLPYHFFENTSMYLFNIGLSNRSYYRDYYVYRFGVQEDVPAGRIVNLVAGYETRGSGDRLYAGLEAGTGNYFDNFGYLTMRAGFGTFFHKSDLEQSVLNLKMGYFSDLFQINKTRFRQFAKFGIAYGFNRIEKEYLHLNGDIRGLESDELKGIKKANLNLQTQAYLPFSVIGFRFAPFVFVDFGLIADKDHTLMQSRLYQGYGFGLLIKNELLVINSFQFAIAFYPFIPEKNGSYVKYNPSKTYDFSFDDFGIQAPSVLPLQ